MLTALSSQNAPDGLPSLAAQFDVAELITPYSEYYVNLRHPGLIRTCVAVLNSGPFSANDIPLMHLATCRTRTRRLQRSPHVRTGGFTLLEMIVVLVIIGLIMGLVGPRLFSQADKAKVQTAQTQVKMLRGALDTMRLDISRYPSQEEGLALLMNQPTDSQTAPRWQGPYLEDGVPNDPWGNPYKYLPEASGTHPFSLYSLGADGKSGGTGFDTDIGELPQKQATQ